MKKFRYLNKRISFLTKNMLLVKILETVLPEKRIIIHSVSGGYMSIYILL